MVVSIPTHPEGQVQLPAWGLYSPTYPLFQSPPTPKGRCNEETRARIGDVVAVSIPTHPEGQVQPGYSRW